MEDLVGVLRLLAQAPLGMADLAEVLALTMEGIQVQRDKWRLAPMHQTWGQPGAVKLEASANLPQVRSQLRVPSSPPPLGPFSRRAGPPN